MYTSPLPPPRRGIIGPWASTDSTTLTAADETSTLPTPTLRPLLTEFSQPSGCQSSWYLTTIPGPTFSSVISSGYRDPRYSLCQPDAIAEPSPWFSPGICPGHMTSVKLNPITRVSYIEWAVTCCQSNFILVEPDMKNTEGHVGLCSSTVPTTRVPTLYIDPPTTRYMGESYPTNVAALHDPVIAFFRGSDLCNFPAKTSAQLVAFISTYFYEHTLEGCVRLPGPTVTAGPTVTSILISTVAPTETPTTTPDPVAPPPSGRKVSGATIGGAVVGALAGLALVVAALFFLLRRRRRTSQENSIDPLQEFPQDHAPELDGTEKGHRRIPSELHDQPKAAELATYYLPQELGEPSGYNYYDTGVVSELDGQQAYWNPAPNGGQVGYHTAAPDAGEPGDMPVSPEPDTARFSDPQEPRQVYWNPQPDSGQEGRAHTITAETGTRGHVPVSPEPDGARFSTLQAPQQGSWNPGSGIGQQEAYATAVGTGGREHMAVSPEPDMAGFSSPQVDQQAYWGTGPSGGQGEAYTIPTSSGGREERTSAEPGMAPSATAQATQQGYWNPQSSSRQEEVYTTAAEVV
ncbi:hypothetical protein GE09DRAFT_620163 [Coniochaeta sp. 2T2.1]|nr:hypothetical protein GE09DRAFT_620163 [Coniochaeta sp. 2T2.1]